MADQLEVLRAALAGHYAVERVLGQGGSATVYLARDLKLDREVAIKVLRPEIAESVGAERFVREIKVTAHLQHPHIVTVTDSGVAEGLLYFVLPYVHGESLRGLLRRTPQLEVAEAVRLAREIADGLAYAHGEGIIHRDIKPENVLLSDGHAVITDFGLAKATATSEGVRLTGSGLSMGTPLYMSPEQAAGGSDVDARSDLYALTCVLYEMLAGEPPFSGATPQAVVARHIYATPPSIRIVRPGVSPAIAAVIERGLAKVPADRYKSVADFAAALEGALVEHPVRTSMLRNPRARALLVVAVVLVAGWLAWQGPRLVESSRGNANPALIPSNIAVLALRASSPDLKSFAANLTGRLTDALSSIEALTVAPRRSLIPFEKETVSLDSMARTLHVGTFIDGDVEAEQSRVRITVRLIDGRSLRQIETHHVGTDLPDRQFLVDAVADTVTASLRRMLGPTIKKRRQALETRSAAAFDLVQRAEERLASFDAQLKVPDLPAAHQTLDATDSLFAAAERLDAHWVEPIVGRGKLSPLRVMLAAAERKPGTQQMLTQGLAHAERAMKLAPNNPLALQLRGTLRYQVWNDYRPADSALRNSAEADLRRSLDGNPERSRVQLTLSQLVAADGRLQEALGLAETAYKSDPYLELPDQIVLRLFEYSFELGMDVAAAHWCDEGLVRFPDVPYFYDCQLQMLAWSDLRQPDPVRARSLKASTLTHYEAPALHALIEPRLDMLVGVVYARAGRPDSARAILSRGLAVVPARNSIVIPAASILTLLGEKDRGVNLVVTYAAKHPAERKAMLRNRGLGVLLREPRVIQALGPPVRR